MTKRTNLLAFGTNDFVQQNYFKAINQFCLKKNYLNDVIFEILRHVRFGNFGQVVVGHRLPAVDPVQLEQEAGLAVVVAVVFFADAFDVAALWEFQVST